MEDQQTFDAIIWLAGMTLAHRGTLETLIVDGIDAVMEKSPYDDLTDAQRDTVRGVIEYEGTRNALLSYWKEYDDGRTSGDIPQAESPWLNGK